jgi:hypothetical protein
MDINNKLAILKSLKSGDEIKCNNNGNTVTVEFIKANRKTFVGNVNNNEYTIPVNCFISVADSTEKAITETPIKSKKQPNIWCHCNNEEYANNAIYVEDYKGVNHGWICPHCRKFVQIG